MSGEDIVENAFKELEGKVPEASDLGEFGPIAGKSTSGPRILMIDDDWGVIKGFQRSEESYLAEQHQLVAQLHFFRIGNKKNARLPDCVAWIKAQEEPFDAIYIDGDLGTQGNGIMLSERIRGLPGLRYQPIALITADESFFLSQADSHADLRIMGKFDILGSKAIGKLIMDRTDVRAQAHDKIWTDAHAELLKDLDSGTNVEAAAEELGQKLKDHLSACAWYLRELRGDALFSVAANDEYFQAGSTMKVNDAPNFQIDLVREKDNTPWINIEALTDDHVGARKDMIGYRAIAARVGSKLGGEVTAVFTAYRTPHDEPFTQSDAMQLHHAAILLRLAMSPKRISDRLLNLSIAIEKVFSAKSTAEITAEMCDFLQEQIHKPLEYRGIRTKTTARLFLRGSGELRRWGEDKRRVHGSLKSKQNEKLWINDDCVYARAIQDAKTKSSLLPEEKGKKFVQTTEESIKEYVTVPLIHDDAVLGAINLETMHEDAYSMQDISLAEAVARVAAAAILGHRSQRFMRRLARLTARAINPIEEKGNDPDTLLDSGAEILYELYGFSDMLLLESHDGIKEPWKIVKAWRGDGASSIGLEDIELVAKQTDINAGWTETFLYECLNIDDRDTFFISDKEAGLSDSGTNNLRDEDRPTWFHFLRLLGSQGNRTRAVVLLFEHPHPLTLHFERVFSAYALFIDTIYSSSFEKMKSHGQALATARLEARAGKVFSQYRHSFAGHINSIFNAADLGRKEGKVVEALDDVVARLRKAQQDMENARNLLRLPRFEYFDLSEIWVEVVHDAKPRIDALGVYVDPNGDRVPIFADPHVTKFILFNILDNALEHGVENGATSIQFTARQNGCVICDDGGKLSEEMRQDLFEMGSTTRATTGGHGLFMSKDIARDMNADLYYKREGKKNCFVLIFDQNNE